MRSGSKNYDQLQSAISAVNSARNADPVAFGMKEGAVGQIDFTDLNSLQSSMQARAVQAGRISQQYGTPPTLLTKAEAKQFSTMLSQSAPGDALTLLQAVGRSLPPQGVSMFQAQLGENNPTYGALAGILAAPDNYLNTRSGIGSYVDYPLTVDKYIASERILQGYRALSPSAQDKKIWSNSNHDTFRSKKCRSHLMIWPEMLSPCHHRKDRGHMDYSSPHMLANCSITLI